MIQFSQVISSKKNSLRRNCLVLTQVSSGNKNRFDKVSYYQNKIEKTLHLDPEDCKNELKRSKVINNKENNQNLVNFQTFLDSAHHDENFPYQGVHEKLTYDVHDKNWIPHIGINDPSSCKVDSKNSGYEEIKLLDWKIHLEKEQLTRNLKDDTTIYEGI